MIGLRTIELLCILYSVFSLRGNPDLGPISVKLYLSSSFYSETTKYRGPAASVLRVSPLPCPLAAAEAALEEHGGPPTSQSLRKSVGRSQVVWVGDKPARVQLSLAVCWTRHFSVVFFLYH